MNARFLGMMALIFCIVQSALFVVPLQSTHAATQLKYDYNDDDVPAKYKQAYHDYVDYYAQLDPLLKHEEIALKIFKENKKVDPNDHRSAYVEITGIALPNYKKFVQGVKQIYAPNQDIARMHKKYVRGSIFQLEGMLLFQKYLSKKKLDPTVLKKANTKLAAANTLLTQFHKEIDTYNNRFSY